MRRLLLLPITSLALLGATAPQAPAARCAGADAVPTASNAKTVRTATLCLINKERTKRGRGRLRANRTLQGVATKYARQMVRQEFFAHVSPGGSTLTSRIRSTRYLQGVRSWSLGENLAWGSGSRATPAQTVRAWMDSPGHRRNMLDRRFTEIGVGVALGAPVAGVGEAATYATEFGRRKR